MEKLNVKLRTESRNNQQTSKIQQAKARFMEESVKERKGEEETHLQDDDQNCTSPAVDFRRRTTATGRRDSGARLETTRQEKKGGVKVKGGE